MTIADNLELDAQVPAASARRQSVRHPQASLLRLQVLVMMMILVLWGCKRVLGV